MRIPAFRPLVCHMPPSIDRVIIVPVTCLMCGGDTTYFVGNSTITHSRVNQQKARNA